MKTQAFLFLALASCLAARSSAAWPLCYNERMNNKNVYSCLATGNGYSDVDKLRYMINDFAACLVPNDQTINGGQLGNYRWFGLKLKMDGPYSGQSFVRVESRGPGVPKPEGMVAGLPYQLSISAHYTDIFRDENLFLVVDCFMLPRLGSTQVYTEEFDPLSENGLPARLIEGLVRGERYEFQP